MSQHITSFEEADEKLKKILIFLKRQGGAYKQIRNVGTMQTIILNALKNGTYSFDDTHFVCWRYLDGVLIVDDAAGDLSKIRRVMRKNIKKGIGWLNQKTGRLIYSSQKEC